MTLAHDHDLTPTDQLAMMNILRFRGSIWKIQASMKKCDYQKHSGSIPRNACRLRNIAMHDYQESVTTGQTHRKTRQTPDKVIPMCGHALQETQTMCQEGPS